MRVVRMAPLIVILGAISCSAPEELPRAGTDVVTAPPQVMPPVKTRETVRKRKPPSLGPDRRTALFESFERWLNRRDQRIAASTPAKPARQAGGSARVGASNAVAVSGAAQPPVPAAAAETRSGL
ncbi:MAG: hypothetical protein AB7F35_23690 [Acetobacteraceae bacterium]